MMAKQSTITTLAAIAMHLATPVLGDLQSCPSDTPLSCHNTTTVPNSCCFNHPGGALLLTQFWDTDPPLGPSDSWTIHGLWYPSTSFLSIHSNAPNKSTTNPTQPGPTTATAATSNTATHPENTRTSPQSYNHKGGTSSSRSWIPTGKI